MTRICLDTSAYSQLKRGHAEARRVISSAREVLVPTIVLGELRAGFALGGRRARNETELAELLADPAVRVCAVDEAATAHYADIVVALRRAGTPVPTNDIWIGAVAASNAATVVTFDAHFARIERAATLVLAP